MKNIKVYTLTLLCCLMVGSSTSTSAQILWNRQQLEKAKANMSTGFYKEAMSNLITEADKCLNLDPPSVMKKKYCAANGDKHEYVSLSRYYWPNPNTPDGYPYISKDGESNPDLDNYDRNRLGETAAAVINLGLAWYFSGEDKYADKAMEYLKVWFINEDSQMNPNLEYSQIIPGENEGKGRKSGVLDAYSFVEMLEAVYLLENYKGFDNQLKGGLKSWFSSMVDWVLTHQNGRDEFNSDNNHAVACDIQLVAFATYAGREIVAKNLLSDFHLRRMFVQIEPDGRQPAEMRRTLAYGYSVYNLDHMIDIFTFARHYGIRLDDKVSEDGRSFYKAMDFLTPYVGKEVSSWPYPQIGEWDIRQDEMKSNLIRTYVLNPERTDYRDLFLRTASDALKKRMALYYWSE